MAAFGIKFPKLTLCRSTTSKADTNTVSKSSSPPPPPTTTASARTLSLSIKNVPSQPLHYDVSTTTVKKKPTLIANILAIDGETKQLPKNLSVFNELQLDDEDKDINEKRKRPENSSDIIISSSLSPMGPTNHQSDLRFVTTVDSRKIPNEEKTPKQDRHSNHTFTPPTSCSSHNSSNDLHLTSSTRSIDLPQLKYAIEQFLVDDDNPIYQIADEFPSGYSQDHHGNGLSSNVTKSDLQDQQQDNTVLHSTHDKNANDEVSSHPIRVSNGGMKWYVSELRIHRPLIYRTQLTNDSEYSTNRKFSHSVNDLKDIYNFSKPREKNRTRKVNDVVYSTLSLQNLINQQQYRHQSDDNILFNNHLSFTDDGLNHLHSDEDDHHISPLIKQRTLDQSVGKGDTLIRNESVKKKLFDILNDDELENACLEDMSDEFDKISLNDPHPHHDRQVFNSFSSSSDDALYSSPPSELHLPPPPPPPPLLSSSYNEIPSANINSTTEYYFGRSRLITTSLDKIPMNHNLSSTCFLRPSYEQMRPTWYTSPSPQWRMDDQLPMVSILKRHSLRNDGHLNGIDSNRLLSTNVAEYDVKEDRNIQKYNHHYRKEQKRVNYSLMNVPTALVENSPTVLPIIQDKSSNLLMFI